MASAACTTRTTMPAASASPIFCCRLFRLEAGGPHHLAPLLGFRRDEAAERGGRTRERLAADVGEARFHLGVGKRRVDLLVEPVDDLGRRIARRGQAIPLARLV